ncbi:hypothetical protein [Mycobacterium colombiense]|uniref:hypothetical protein n=1 Tax=Mycobacterium colombiense TaxID=339268 RepID=UPI0011518055|nr:hypothetical protein [Mycobacterium colombiense]
MTKLDSRLREALKAARDLSGRRDAPQRAGDSTRGRQLPQSTRVRALAAEQLVRMGFDATSIDRELAAERAENHRRLEKLKAEAVAQSGARAETLGRTVDAQRQAWGGVIGVGPPTTQYLTLDSPVEIWATDGVSLESTTIEPYKSRAQIRLDASESHDWWHGAYLFTTNYDFLHFYFLWENQQSESAVVDVNAILILNGFCSAHSQGGWFFGGKGELTLDPTLDLLQTWTQPLSSAPPQTGETWNVLDLVADSTGFDTDDKTNYEVVYRGTVVGYQQEIVPPGQYLIIDVALRLGSYVDNSDVSADFATGEFYVMSPLVGLKAVYPAIGAVYAPTN